MKYKNIYKLEKKTTKTKLIPIHGEGTCFHDGNVDSIQTKVGMDGDEECWETVAEIWPSYPKTQSKADAIMIAHCRNHFMEAIQLAYDLLTKAQDSALLAETLFTENFDVYRKRIAKLETVEEI